MTVLQAIISAGVAYEEERRAVIEECQRATQAARDNFHRSIEAAQAKLHAAMKSAYGENNKEYNEISERLRRD